MLIVIMIIHMLAKFLKSSKLKVVMQNIFAVHILRLLFFHKESIPEHL